MFGPANSLSDGSAEISKGPIYTASSPWGAIGRNAFRKTRGDATRQQETSSESINAPSRWDHVRDESPRASTRALLALKHAVVFTAFSCTIAALALVLNVPQWWDSVAGEWGTSFSHCNYNGVFTPDENPSINLWNKAGFFYITIAWGEMSFSTAKFIDIVWDIVVGRGGQALLAWITYRVSSQYLAMAMRDAPVSYATYESLAFVPPSLLRTGRLARDLLTHRGWQPRLIMLWIIMSSLFVLSFSSFVTAMSGYSSNKMAVVTTYGGASVAWTDFEAVQFAINDGSRIGEPGRLIITSGDTCVQQGLSSHTQSWADDENAGANVYDRRDEEGFWSQIPGSCTLFWRTVEYVSEYGLEGSHNISSTFIQNGILYNLTSPTLNITTSYSATSISELSAYLRDFSTEASDNLAPISKVSDSTFWAFQGQTYSYDYVNDHALCRYSQWHNWGFSFLLLFITTLLLAIWAIGTYALWLYVCLHRLRSQESRHGGGAGPETPGIYRSSWDLVEAMRRDLGPEGVKPEMREAEIRSLLRRRRRGAPHDAWGVSHVHHMPTQTYRNSRGMETEKTPSSPASTSQIPSQRPSRWDGVRTWLYPSTQPSRPILNDSTSTYSSTSRHPMLASPTAMGSMSPHMSALASPSPSSIFTFTNQPISELDMIGGPGLDIGADTVPASLSRISNRHSRPRLSRLVPSSHSHSHSQAQVPTRSLSPSSSGTWWDPTSTPGSACVSLAGSSPISAPSRADPDSPIQAMNKDGGGRRDSTNCNPLSAIKSTRSVEEKALAFRNDLGDD